jgi:hypothetical protein
MQPSTDRFTAKARNTRKITPISHQRQSTKGDFAMCYNCGCGMPNNDMGNPANITNKTFEDAAKTMKQSAEDARKNARQLLDRVINSQQQSNDKNWKP